MPHSRGGPHRLGGRAAPLRCRDAQASPRRIAEAAVLVPTLVPDPRFRHPASGTRPPAPGIWHLASGLRLGTRFPDARSVDAAPISERWKIQLFRRSFLYPSPCPRQPHSCSASVHRLPRPPVLSALFCLPSFRYFTSSLVRAARRPLRAASCRLALLIACRRALFSTSCRHLVSPSFCASVPPSFCASVQLSPDAFFPLFLGRFLSSPDELSPIHHPSKGAQAVPFGACP